jgi:hypothetical protein
MGRESATRVIVMMSAAWIVATGSATAQSYCVRPTPPTFPAPDRAGALSSADLDRQQAARDEYFVAADAYLDCTNGQIERRLAAMFASNAPLDSTLQSLGRDHERVSAERANVYEQFVTMCMAWEDATEAPLPGRCATVVP